MAFRHITWTGPDFAWGEVCLLADVLLGCRSGGHCFCDKKRRCF